MGYYPSYNNICSPDQNRVAEIIDSKAFVEKNTQVVLGGESSINHFSKHQLDILAYTFPYHMQESNNMKPPDCQDLTIAPDINTLHYTIKQFNLRHPLI